MLLEEFLRPLEDHASLAFDAIRLRCGSSRLNEIVRGVRERRSYPIRPCVSSASWGCRADFWLGLQLDWDLWHAMRSQDAAAIAQLQPIPRVG